MPPTTRSKNKGNAMVQGFSKLQIGDEQATTASVMERKGTNGNEKRPFALRDISNNGAPSNRKGQDSNTKSGSVPNNKRASESQSFDSSHMELLEEIGVGAQSQVFRGRDTRDGRMYAVKVIDSNCNPKYADRELAIHQSLEFPGIVKLHGHYRMSGSVAPAAAAAAAAAAPKQESLCLVLELCSHSILDALQKIPDGRIPETEAAKYVLDTAKALKYLHSKGIIHRDVKLANILVSSDGNVKVADLGVATRVGDRRDRKTIIGTRGYMAPEIDENTSESEAGARYVELVREMGAAESFNIPPGIDLYDSRYDEKVDAYSLGAAIYIMLTGKQFDGDETEGSLGFDFGFGCLGGDAFDFEFAESVMSMNALDLILGLLDEDPMERLSLDDVLHHPWLLNNLQSRVF